ncbi:MAG: alpha/beta hydrolase-fold protein [Ignavibacteriaceae bacterium]|jgi:predicted esterase/DNA-binding beta-propeller fold protein YncE
MTNRNIFLLKFLATLAILILILSNLIFAQSPLANNMEATGVLGQLNFTMSQSGTSSTALNSPSGATVDPTTGKLFVVDRYNNRILRWSSTAKMNNGSSAEAVLGQPDFNTATSGLSASKFNDPLRAHVDITGNLWVSDYLNNRILRFDKASSKLSGASADAVLGQSNFTTNSGGTSASKIKGPVGVFTDINGRLWITDRLNHRVLRFDNASLKANGSNADAVLGQSDFTTGTSGLSASKMNRPMGIYADASDHLWVCEDDNNRVIRFDDASLKSNGAEADGVLGQPDFNTNLKNQSRNGVGNLRGVFGDDAGRLYVVDESNHRVLIFNHAAKQSNGAFADYVLGQPDFGSNPIIQQEISDPSTLNYLLFMPRDTTAVENGKYPLIISLHGIGESGSDLWKVKLEGLPKILDGKNSFPFIVVSPQCPSTTEWYYDRTDLKLNKLIDSIIARYPVDTNRIYLTGYSMGGIGTLDMAIRYPNRFAALLPIAFRIESGWELYGIKDIPMWAFHGERDNIIPFSNAQSVINAIIRCGGNPLFTAYADLYHDSWTRTYNNPAIFEWLLTKRKH